MALRLRWEDETYVRIYVRDTIDWQALTWNAQALYMQLCRKATRKGRIDLGRAGRNGIPALLGRPDMEREIADALGRLEADGCVVVEGSVLTIAEFVEAQTAISSNAKRQRNFRERERDEEQDERNDSLRETVDALRPQSTAQHSNEQESTAPPLESIPPAREPTGNGTGLSWDEDVAAQTRELEAEVSREDARRARTLAALGAAWRTSFAVADALGRKGTKATEDDLRELRSAGLVERQEMPASSSPTAPPVTHWRRKQPAVEVAGGAA